MESNIQRHVIVLQEIAGTYRSGDLPRKQVLGNIREQRSPVKASRRMRLSWTVIFCNMKQHQGQSEDHFHTSRSLRHVGLALGGFEEKPLGLSGHQVAQTSRSLSQVGLAPCDFEWKPLDLSDHWVSQAIRSPRPLGLSGKRGQHPVALKSHQASRTFRSLRPLGFSVHQVSQASGARTRWL